MNSAELGTVFVTGASSGFGAVIARRFAAVGARVVATARRAERLKGLAAELGPLVLPVMLDVRDRAAVTEAVGGLAPEFAEIQVLVNNAGLALGLNPAQDADLDDWEQNDRHQLQGPGLLHPGYPARHGGPRPRSRDQPRLGRGSLPLSGRKTPTAVPRRWSNTSSPCSPGQQPARADRHLGSSSPYPSAFDLGDAAREAPCLTVTRPSRITPSSATCIPWRWWPRTGQSTGAACPGLTRQRCSRPCWTPTAAVASQSAARRSGPGRCTSPIPTCW